MGENIKAKVRHIWFQDKNLVIPKLVVDPSHRRKGIASKLIEKMERTAKIVNCDMLTCTTSSPAHQSILFFKNTGWSLAEDPNFNVLGLDFYQTLQYYKKVKDQNIKVSSDKETEIDKTLTTIAE